MRRMDDTEDDSRYPPPNGYHPIHNRRSPFLSSSRSTGDAIVCPQFNRMYTREDDEDESEEEINGVDQEIESDVKEDEDDEVVLGESRYARSREEESSPDSRGKRKKLNKFEFSARSVAPPTPVPSSAVESSKPPARNNPADWTEESTFVLLDAWGVLYVKNGRKSLRSDEWLEVAKKVNETSRTPRSDGQCRNRIDTLKKKYKKEKSKIAESLSSSSTWIHFKKMKELMGVPTPLDIAPWQQSRLPSVVDSAGCLLANSRHHVNWLNSPDVTRDSPTGSESTNDDEDGDDESEGLPPECTKKSMYPAGSGSGSGSFRMLAESIQKFSEIYERIEHSKRQHMAELQKIRWEFQRDLEMQKGLILEKAQEELEKLREEESDGEEDSDNNNDDIDGFPENSSS